MEGNQMKMREAFDEIIEKIDAWRTDGTMEHWQYNQLFDIANAALALPLHQCEVGTAEEQYRRYKCFCKSHQYISCDSEEGFPPIYVCSDKSCPLHRFYLEHGEDACEFAWAQMPYEAEEGGTGK